MNDRIQHTPWRVERYTDGNGCNIRDERNATIAAIGTRDGLANARLIAAAPQLLEALETALCSCPAEKTCYLHNDEFRAAVNHALSINEGAAGEWQRQAYAAIAQARGERFVS